MSGSVLMFVCEGMCERLGGSVLTFVREGMCERAQKLLPYGLWLNHLNHVVVLVNAFVVAAAACLLPSPPVERRY